MDISIQRHTLSVCVLSAAGLLAGCDRGSSNPVWHQPDGAADAAANQATESPGSLIDPEGHVYPKPPTFGGRRLMMRRGDGGAVRPTPPEVTRCVREADGGDSLMSCLGAIAPTPAHSMLDDGLRFFEGTAYAAVFINPAWQVPEWHINPSTGNDANTCVDAAHSCKTCQQILARWGTLRPFLTTNVIILQDADGADECELRPVMLPGSLFNFLGKTTVTASGTLATVTAKNRNAGQVLKSDLGVAATGAQGLMIWNSTHPSRAWVDSVSGTVATITQPFAASVTNTGAPAVSWQTSFQTIPPEVDTWTNGDAFTVVRLTQAKVTAFAPEVIGTEAGVGDGALAQMGHIWIPDPTSGRQSFIYSASARMSENRIDGFAQTETHNDNNVFNYQLFNSWLSGGGTFVATGIAGGALNTQSSLGISIASGVVFDGDIMLHQEVDMTMGGFLSLSVISPVFSDGLVIVGGPVWIAQEVYATGQLYGSYTIDSSFGGKVFFDDTAQQKFTGSPTLQENELSFGSAKDLTRTPSPTFPHIALTPLLLDTPIASGGFGGVAFSPAENSAYINTSAMRTSPVPTPYVTPEGNGGTGRDAGCPSGQFLGNEPLSCSTPSGTGATCPINLASCVTGVLPIANGGTNAISLPANDLLIGGATVTGLAPGASGNVATSNGTTWTSAPNTSASCPINLASCVSGSLPETNGGTDANLTGCSAGAVFFQQAGQFGCILPLPASQGGTGQTGLPLTEANGGTDANLGACSAGSVFIQGATQFQCVTALGVPSGGTSSSSFTPHAVLLGENASPFGLATVGTAGNVFTDNGPGVDPSFLPPAVSMSRFVAGQFSGSATLGGTGLFTLANVTLTTGRDVMVIARFEFTSGDTINNIAAYGVTVGTCATISSVEIAMVPSGSFFGNSPSIMNYERVLRFSGLVAGSNSFCFLAQNQRAPSTVNPAASVEGVILF